VHSALLDLLVCPACRGALRWQVRVGDGERIEEADAVCEACGSSYPTRGGIGAFLTPDLQRTDLWESVESGLSQYLRAQPELEHRLLEGPLDSLNPADRFFRGYVLEERGRGVDADEAFDSALPALYTAETRAASERMADAVVSVIPSGSAPVVDVASGRGFLVERLARVLARPIVATDFSPTVLRRTQSRFRRQGLGDAVSFLAVDARRTPFADRSLPVLTTYVGLENIGEPEGALAELRRVSAGTLYWVASLYGAGDPNEPAIRNLGSTLSLRSEMQRAVTGARWTLTTVASSRARVRPTHHGELVDAGIDGIPVEETTVEWAVLALS
jgi:uncharacterized protein YbaR (Trm112 family)